MENEQDLIRQGVCALRARKKEQAYTLFHKVVEANPDSEQGWLWLSAATDNSEENTFCLQNVLAINAEHSGALRRLGRWFSDNKFYVIKFRVRTRMQTEFEEMWSVDETILATVKAFFNTILAGENIFLPTKRREQLFESICADLFGYGPLDTLLADDTVTAIMVNGPKN